MKLLGVCLGGNNSDHPLEPRGCIREVIVKICV